MRLILAAMLLAAAPAIVVHAEPQTCPPVCDQIPDTAWIDSRAIPLNSTYHWPALAGAATPVTGTNPRFRFEELCRTAGFPPDTRESAVAARADVTHPPGQWQLQAHVLHWRGDTARGGQDAMSVFNTAAAALRGCGPGAPARRES
jgi:hypothetical protein